VSIPNLKLKDHLLSVVRDLLLLIFTATLPLLQPPALEDLLHA